MSVIDSHHHFWWLHKHNYHWPEPARPGLNRDFTPADLKRELDACGIEGSVLVQVLHETGETGEYLDISREFPFVRGVVGWVPLADPKAAARDLENLRKRGKLVGIRHLISNEPDPDWLLQPSVQDGLKLVAGQKLAFDGIPINTRQLEAVITTAERQPDLSVVLNHLGRPPIPEQGWEPWATLMNRAAACPNVTVKLSIGLDIVMRWRWSTDAVRRYSDHVIERFGAARVMAASNWPVVLLAGSYADVWRGTTDLLSGLNANDRAAVLGGTAERVYGL